MPPPPAAEPDPDPPPPPRRRASDRESLFGDLPLWARVIAIVGIPGTIAFFLVYVGAQTLPNIQTELAAYRMAVDRNHELYERQAAQAEATYRLLQRICSNVAKNDVERSRCFDR